MKHIYEARDEYAVNFTSLAPPLLATIQKETYEEVSRPQMICGHFQGRVLAMISHMIKPSFILEIGTFTGYSALCLLEGLQQKGVLHTIDNNQLLEERVQNYFAQITDKKIIYHIGKALTIIPTLRDVFDLIFIDADKKNYTHYYDLTLPKLRKGGFMLIDNMLLGNRVLPDIHNKSDKRAQMMMNFNKKIHDDPRIENVLLPIRDGLMLNRKK